MECVEWLTSVSTCGHNWGGHGGPSRERVVECSDSAAKEEVSQKKKQKGKHTSNVLAGGVHSAKATGSDLAEKK